MKRLGLIAWLYCGLPCGGAQAEPRALLVGVGDYNLPGAELPGIDTDIRLMTEASRWMGFSDDQVLVLESEQATQSRVEWALQRWLVDGVDADDPVLIYFSGHGVRVWDESGDEADDLHDEALLLFDAHPVELKGRPSLDGLLLDDRFGDYLKQIPSRQVLVLVDACHSGSVNKDLGDALGRKTKFYAYPGMPSGTGSLRISNGEDKGANYLVISAAGDDEQALPSEQGSYFTLGIYQRLKHARAGQQSIDARELMQAAQAYISDQVVPAYRYHPHLSGNPALARRPIVLH
jgi:hypothetical protein